MAARGLEGPARVIVVSSRAGGADDTGTKGVLNRMAIVRLVDGNIM